MLKPLPAGKPSLSNRSSTSQPPPLWVWGATGIGVLIGFVLLLIMALRSEEQLSQRFTQDAETLLRREWVTRSDSVTRVVILGTSLVEYGVADTDYFQHRCGKGVRVVKLYREAVNIDAFTNESPIFQFLERYPPDILCIEENLLLFRLPYSLKLRLGGPLAEPINRHLWIQAETAKIQVGWVAPMKQPFQGFPRGQHQLNQEDTVNLSTILTEIRSRKVRTKTDLPALYGSLQRLHQSGTRLVLLQLPRPAALETVIYGEDRATLLQELITYYKQRYRLDYWQFNQPLPFRYFTDQAHLNYIGNPIYSAWLADKICKIHAQNKK